MSRQSTGLSRDERTGFSDSFASPDNRRTLDPLVTDDEAADYLRVKPQTLRKWRVSGDGPPFIRIKSMVRYRLSDLIAFVEAGVRTSTSELRA